MRAKLTFILIGILIAGCKTIPGPMPRENLGELCRLLSNDVNDEVVTLFDSFGEPGNISIKYYPNKHLDDVIDEVHTATYYDGEVQVYSATSIGRNYLLRIALTRQFWPASLPRYIGKTHKELIKYFGEPKNFKETEYLYYCDQELYDYIKFYFSAGAVSKVEIKAWLD